MLTYDHYSIEQATALQLSMREQIILKPLGKEVKTVGGADISYNKNSTKVFAAIVVLDYPTMILRSYSLFENRTTFPFIHNYLGFREIPTLMLAWEQLKDKPDVLILDGQGITHPRNLGVATHFGILGQHPAIGCAKNMIAADLTDLGLGQNSHTPFYRDGKLLGYSLRTVNSHNRKSPIEPVYISPGNLITPEETLKIMKNCTGNLRIPAPTRMAHEFANAFRTGKLQEGFYFHQESQQTLF
jgi:deoxyribonuclease V